MSIPKVRADLVGQEPYGAPQLDVPVRLNVNENPYGPSQSLIAAIAQSVATVATQLNRYPDRDAIALRSALADYVNKESKTDVAWQEVWAANGSNEVMHHLLQAFGGPGRKLVTFSPTYSMYEEYCRETFTEFATVARDESFAISRAAVDAALALGPHILVMCSPNNPTGTVLDPEVLDYAESKFDGLIIVDEAYAEFRSPGTESALVRFAHSDNVVVTRTMSKAFSCAGLRLGYVLSNPEIINALMVVRLPYHLSAVTQAVALAAISHSEELLGQVDALRKDRDALAAWLASQNFEVLPSGANFLLFGKFADRHAVWQGLLDHGVLIRETGPAGFLRVSIGTPTENEAFRNALLAITK
jgi:histidinol-phosphate aminotransferase